eukprot:TRINITY_DN521_c1_g1_i10.p1 TRINITY_DN521_c1_g1~~TRINITY_DN521_c1_g1_i10.p1  ORF type:complete len:205 (-),score=17.60 TRINITY_DN521_c1_g1_i10:656-1270(-)
MRPYALGHRRRTANQKDFPDSVPSHLLRMRSPAQASSPARGTGGSSFPTSDTMTFSMSVYTASTGARRWHTQLRIAVLLEQRCEGCRQADGGLQVGLEPSDFVGISANRRSDAHVAGPLSCSGPGRLYKCPGTWCKVQIHSSGAGSVCRREAGSHGRWCRLARLLLPLSCVRDVAQHILQRQCGREPIQLVLHIARDDRPCLRE